MRIRLKRRDLWIWISTKDYDEAAFAKLDELIENWWVDAADTVQVCNMGINLDWQEILLHA